MKDGVVLRFQDEEELAQAFADEVAENYVSLLEFWEATSREYPEEQDFWCENLKFQPDIVRKNAFYKILTILKDENCQQYAKTWRRFKSKRFISITRSCGFYDDLLRENEKTTHDEKNEESIRYSAPYNVEYILNRKKYTLQKKIYSGNTEL